MINSLCGSMGSLKTETSCSTTTKLLSTSPTESGSEVKKTVSSSGLEESSSLTPPSIDFAPVKFELDGGGGDVEVQSPDSSMWETFFTDIHLDGDDFMVLSPVRNLPSPRSSSYSYAPATMQGQSSLSRCSPPRFSPHLGAFSSSLSLKARGQSPLRKVFNSPNNQYMQPVENLALPAIEDFLEDYVFSPMRTSNAGSNPSHLFETTPPPSSDLAMVDCLTLQSSSRFGESSSTAGDSHIYQLGSSINATAPQNTTHSINHHSFMVPLPISSEQEQDSGLQLVHLLLACAEAVAKEDYMLARRYLHHLNRVVSPLGDSMQRVAACFTEALSARLAATLTTNLSTSASPKPFSPFPPNSLEVLKIYQIVYQACPYVKFAHFTANQAIFEAFEGEERVHVIDLDILQGYQWPAFMQALAVRPGGAPFLRITGVGTSIECIKETGRCLMELAHSLQVPFEFHPVGEELEDLKPHMFNRRVGEALAINSVNRLHRVPVNCLGNLLAMIREQAPNIVTLVEQEASHNGPYFLGRFLEALHYYSAIFDSLDVTFPLDSAQRAKVEQYIFAPEIRNIVACEGAERTERHERLEKWRKVMEGKGFKEVPLSANAVTQSKILLGLYSCDGYRLTEEKGCLLLGWQDRAIVAASAWRC